MHGSTLSSISPRRGKSTILYTMSKHSSYFLSKFLVLVLLSSYSTAKAFMEIHGRSLPTRNNKHWSSAASNNRWMAPNTTLTRRLRGGATTNKGTTTKLRAVTSLIDTSPFWGQWQIYTAINLLGFVVSVVSGGSQLHVDLLGTGAFAAAAVPTALSTTNSRIKLSSACVIVWGTKLASFLCYRAFAKGHDARIESLFLTVGGTAQFWIASLVWGLLCSLPHTLGTVATTQRTGAFEVAGTAVYLLGLGIETLADYQKWNFKNSNPGKFCNVGLWSISQHPNFFGNLLLWAGIFMLNGPALIDPAPIIPTDTSPLKRVFSHLWRFKRLALAALSPLFMWTLFSSQANGSVTPTMELANSKYGKDPEYSKYLQEVPLIVPRLFGGGK